MDWQLQLQQCLAGRMGEERTAARGVGGPVMQLYQSESGGLQLARGWGPERWV